jgi:hypothetical protein
MSSFGRIGKSLLKYLKPVRTAQPHDEAYEKKRAKLAEQEASPKIIKASEITEIGDPSQEQKKGFRLLQLKKSKKQTNEQIKAAEAVKLAESTEREEIKLEKANPQWLELVIHLLTVCRRVSEKMKHSMGIRRYQEAATAASTKRVKMVGGIINTNQDYNEIERKDKKVV